MRSSYPGLTLEGLTSRPSDDAGYAAGAYASQLAELGALVSMSRRGCCYDYAPMESFFHTLKVELGRQRRWSTHDEARRDLFSYIEAYYNRRRVHSAIGYVTPEQAERMVAQTPFHAIGGRSVQTCPWSAFDIASPFAPASRETASAVARSLASSLCRKGLFSLSRSGATPSSSA